MQRLRRPGWHKHKLASERKGASLWIAALWRDIWAVTSADARPLVFAFCLCAGSIAYFAWPREPDLAAFSAATGAIAAAWLVTRLYWRLQLLSFPALIAFGAIAGFSAGAVRTRLVAAPVIEAETRPVMVEGWVREIEPGSHGDRVRLEVHAIAGRAHEETPRFVRLTHRARLEVAPGRFVRCWAVLRPPPSPVMPGEYDFRRQAWFEQLGAVGYVQGRCRGGSLGAPAGTFTALGLKVAAIRRRLAEHVHTAAGERAGGFAAALVSGDRSFMNESDQDALRQSGLSHLLAISGLHMSIVGGLVFLLVRRGLALIEPLALRVAVQKPAALAALLASFVYLVISGASVSTQRAFIMLAVVFGAVLADRAALSLRSYAIAMILVVLLQPESVMTPGFQMSFAATGALIATYEAWSRHRSGQERIMGPVRYAWASLLLTSLVASLATAPFAFYHFGRIATLGVVANLLAMPVITFVSAPLAAFTLLAIPFGFGDLGLRLFGLSLEAVLAIAHICASFEGGAQVPGQAMPSLALALFATALAAAIAARGWARLLLATIFLVGAGAAWSRSDVPIAIWAPSGDLFVHETGSGWNRYSLVDGDGLSPLRFSKIGDATICSPPSCEASSAETRLTITPGTENPNISISSGGETQTVYWTDVVASGGLTFAQRRNAPGVLLEHPACSHRPWQACTSRTGVPVRPADPG